MNTNPVADSTIDPIKSEKNYEGLGGWLILVGLGLLITPIRMIVQLSDLYEPFMSIDVWKGLFTAGSDLYNPKVGLYVGFEALGNMLSILVAGIALVFFFQRRTAFPKLYVVFLIGNFLFLIADALAAFYFSPMKQRSMQKRDEPLAKVFWEWPFGFPTWRAPSALKQPLFTRFIKLMRALFARHKAMYEPEIGTAN